MKRTLILTALVAFLAVLLAAADISGKWRGSFTGGDQDRQLTFDFARGEALTGTVSGMLDHALEIKEGKISGGEI